MKRKWAIVCVCLTLIAGLVYDPALQGYAKKDVATEEEQNSQEMNADVQVFPAVRYWETEEDLTSVAPAKTVNKKAVTKNNYAGCYGYQMLETETQRTAYRRMEQAAIAFHESNEDVQPVTSSGGTQSYYAVSVVLSDLSMEQNELGVTVVSMLYDHPEFFWSKGYSYFVREDTKLVTRATLQCQQEYYDGTARAAMREEIQREIESYLDLIAGVRSDYEKELILHDAIAKKVTYAYSADNEPESERWAHTIEGVFSSAHYSAVCEGYAKSFQLLLNAAGIESNYVVGRASGQGHAWNQVKLDGNWYNVDLTWDDTRDQKSRKYFNVSDDTFSVAHKPFLKTATPRVGDWCYDVEKCTSKEYAFTVQGECKSEQLFTVEYEEPEELQVNIYNQGVSVANGLQVASGTTIEAVLCPDHPEENVSVSLSWGEETQQYEGVLGEEKLSYFFVVTQDQKLSVKYQVLTTPAPTMTPTPIPTPEISAAPTAIVNSGNPTPQPTKQPAGEQVVSQTEQPILSITVPKKRLKIGKTMKVKAKKNGNGTVQFSVSNKKRASIGKTSGKLKGKKAGTVWVKAKWKQLTVRKKVVIYK